MKYNKFMIATIAFCCFCQSSFGMKAIHQSDEDFVPITSDKNIGVRVSVSKDQYCKDIKWLMNKDDNDLIDFGREKLEKFMCFAPLEGIDKLFSVYGDLILKIYGRRRIIVQLYERSNNNDTKKLYSFDTGYERKINFQCSSFESAATSIICRFVSRAEWESFMSRSLKASPDNVKRCESPADMHYDSMICWKNFIKIRNFVKEGL
ncbi:MAG: hypothetical protein LBD81_02320 [Holosporaceae bacterium]|jgi:hypothetical protein|nr:hypothetical protein [Holosporaceae bacterium]